MKITPHLRVLASIAILGFGSATGISAAPNLESAKSSPVPVLPTLAEARKGFVTNLIKREVDNTGPAVLAEKELYDTIKYNAPLGKQDAYVSVDPKDGKKHPAIIWVRGSFRSTIEPPTGVKCLLDFSSAGIIVMIPSFRGGNANPGCKEYFLGEIDDILAAADHLASLPYVDKDRIYLAGTSTGGTTALLASECDSRFRSVFAFGPVTDVSGYGQERLAFDAKDSKETKVRSPLYWMHCIKTPTFVMEGNVGESNIAALRSLKKANRNPLIKFFAVPGATHRNVPEVINPLIARRILSDTGPSCSVELTQETVDAASKDFEAKAKPAVEEVKVPVVVAPAVR